MPTHEQLIRSFWLAYFVLMEGVHHLIIVMQDHPWLVKDSQSNPDMPGWVVSALQYRAQAKLLADAGPLSV